MAQQVPAAAPYTVQSIEAMLGMPRRTIAALVRADYVRPTRGPRNEYRFTFQDVVLLRTAYHLQQAQVPQRRLLRALKLLRARLPDGMPLSGVSLKAFGDRIAVRDGSTHWEPESGQLLIDFDAEDAGDDTVRALPLPARAAATHVAAPATISANDSSIAPAITASAWSQHGAKLEDTDRDAAIAAYRSAIAASPDHVHAYVNLAGLLCEAGRYDEALAVYRQAVQRAPDEPSVHFNGALAMEDLGLLNEAVASYERCLQLAPYLADAHYNLGRLYERTSDPQSALRHYSAYRRLRGGEHGTE